MSEMPEWLKKKRDEIRTAKGLKGIVWLSGFTDCYILMSQREAKLVEALEFYACTENYQTHTLTSDPRHPKIIPVEYEDHHGERARQAIEEVKNETD